MTRGSAQLLGWALCIWALILVRQVALAAPHAAGDTQLRHKCVHDTHVVPSVIQEVGRTRFPDGASLDPRRRLLADSVPAPIRITPVFQLDNLDILPRSFLSSVLVPSATRFLQRLYAVRRPVSGNLLLERSCAQMLTGQWSNGTAFSQCAQWAPLTCLESSLDPQHFDGYTTCSSASECIYTSAGSGVADIDFILYVTAQNTSTCQTGTIAYASFCTQDGATDRPTSGSVNFCPDQVSPTQNWAFQLDTAVHELTHALGFSAALFKYYRDAENVPLVPRNADGSLPDPPDLSAVIGTFSERGTTATKLITPKVTQAARAQFGCATLNGAELENDRGSGTAGSHWEERIYMGELLTAVSQQKPAYSKLTAATLEDSGWYVPSYDVTQPLLWGQGRGCAFPLASCAPGGQVPVDTAFSGFYCGVGFRSWTSDDNVTTVLEHMCTDDDAAVGYCQSCNPSDGTCLTDGCMPILPLSNYVCTNVSLSSNTTNSSSLAFWGQTFSAGSKCISDGSRMWSKDGFERPPVGGGCFQYQCIWDVTGTQASLSVIIGDYSIPCIDGQEVSLAAAGFASGSIGPCPVADTFCEDSSCANDCSNQGICVDGTCHCLIGWAGTSCTQLQCSDGLCPPNTFCDPISGSCLPSSGLPSPSPSASPVAFQPGPSFAPLPSPSPSIAPSLLPFLTPSPSPQPSPSMTPSNVPGRIVLNGYLATCTVCMDANGNLRCDDGELTARSNATGDFLFQNVTSQSYGPLLLGLGDSSCVDVLTQLSPTIIMVAPLGSAVVSPLTTLVQALVDVGHLSEGEAESTARNALAVPSTAQITSGDPIQGLLEGDAGSLEMLKGTTCVSNVAAQLGALLSGLSGGEADSLSVYEAMAILMLGTQTSTSAAKASHVPSSAEAVPFHTSTGLFSEALYSPSKCPVERPDFKSLSSWVPRMLMDVSSTALLNLSDVSTLQNVLNASVRNAQTSGTLLPGVNISADVAASVVNLAANSNALVAAVGSSNATLNLQTLSQIGVVARGSVLGSIQELGAGNLSVAAFVANSTLIAGVASVTSQGTSPGPVTSPAAVASAAAAAAATSAAGTGVYLIAGLLVGLFLVLGGTIAFIFWRWRRLMLDNEQRKGDNEVIQQETEARNQAKKRRSRRITDEVGEEVNGETELEDREESVDGDDESGSSESERQIHRKQHRRHHRRSTVRQPLDESDAKGDDSSSQRDGGTRGNPHLESGSHSSEEENQDRALILNRGTSTAVAHTPAAYDYQTGVYENPTNGSKTQNGSYIYAPQQIIIINRRDGSEDDDRPRHQSARRSRVWHVPQISSTGTATLALGDAPRNDDAEPYVTVPSDDEDSRQSLTVAELDESTLEAASASSGTAESDRNKPPVHVTSLPVVESFAATEDGLLVSSSSGPVSDNLSEVNDNPSWAAEIDRPRVVELPVSKPASTSRTFQPVIEAFTLRDESLPVSGQANPDESAGRRVRGPTHGKPLGSKGERGVPNKLAADAYSPSKARAQESALKSGALSEGTAPMPPKEAHLGKASSNLERGTLELKATGKRPDSAPAKPVSNGSSNTARAESAMRPDASIGQVTSPFRAPSKPAWEEKQGAESRELQSVEETERHVAAASQGNRPSPVQPKSTPLASEKRMLDSPTGKKATGSIVSSPPQVASARFTFDVETPESSDGQQSPLARRPTSPRAPNSALNPTLNSAFNPPQGTGFARISLALLKKAAPAKETQQEDPERQPSGKVGHVPDLQRQPSHVPVLRRQLSVEVPATVLSATRTKSPQKKDQSGPRLSRSPTKGAAQSVTGSDRVAQPRSTSGKLPKTTGIPLENATHALCEPKEEYALADFIGDKLTR